MRTHKNWDNWDDEKKQKYVDKLERVYPDGHPYAVFQSKTKNTSAISPASVDGSLKDKFSKILSDDREPITKEKYKENKLPSKEDIFRNPPSFKVPRGSNTGRVINLKETADNGKIAVYLMEPGRPEIVQSRNHLEGTEMRPDYVVYHYDSPLVRKQIDPSDMDKREVVISSPNYRSTSDTQLINTVLDEEFSGRVNVEGAFLVDKKTWNKVDFNGQDIINVSKFLEDCDKF